MSLDFVVQKCACGGNLKYDQIKKHFICDYCGNIVEREATFDKIKIDGIESVADSARTVFQNIIGHNMEEANKSLNQCNRKGYDDICSCIARLSYKLFECFNSISKEEGKKKLTDLKLEREDFYKNHLKIGVEEINFYESIKSNSDSVFALLYVVFNILHDEERVKFHYNKINVERINSKYINRFFLEELIKRKEYEKIEKLTLNNTINIEIEKAIKNILLYLDKSDLKVKIIQNIYNENDCKNVSESVLLKYLKESNDDINDKIDIVKVLINKVSVLSSKDIYELLCEKVTDENIANKFFELLKSIEKTTSEEEEIFKFVFLNKDKNFLALSYANSYWGNEEHISFNIDSIVEYICVENFDSDIKQKVLDEIYSKIDDNKIKDKICALFLVKDNTQNIKKQFAEYVIKNNISLSNKTLRDYLLKKNEDGLEKVSYVKFMLESGFKSSYVPDLLYDYLIESNDESNVEIDIVNILIDNNFEINNSQFLKYLVSGNDTFEETEKKATIILNGKLKLNEDFVNEYLITVSTELFSEKVLQLILNQNFIITTEAFKRYLIELNASNKINNVQTILSNLRSEKLNEILSYKIADDIFISCITNLYILISKDSSEIKSVIVRSLLSKSNIKNIKVTINNLNTDLKRICRDNIIYIDEMTKNVLKEYRII